MDRRDPGTDIGRLSRINGAVRAQHAGVGTAANECVGRLCVRLWIPATNLARIGVGEDHAAVVKLVGTLGMAEPRGADNDGLLQALLPCLHQLTSPPVKLIAWPVIYAASSDNRNQISPAHSAALAPRPSGTARFRSASSSVPRRPAVLGHALEKALLHLGLDDAGADRVDTDAAVSERVSERARDRQNRRLGRRIGCDVD